MDRNIPMRRICRRRGSIWASGLSVSLASRQSSLRFSLVTSATKAVLLRCSSALIWGPLPELDTLPTKPPSSSILRSCEKEIRLQLDR